MSEQEARALITFLVIITTALMVWAMFRPNYKSDVEHFRRGCKCMAIGGAVHVIAFNFTDWLFWFADAIGSALLLLIACTIFLIGIVRKV